MATGWYDASAGRAAWPGPRGSTGRREGEPDVLQKLVFPALFTQAPRRGFLGNSYAASCLERPRRFEKVSFSVPRGSSPDRNIIGCRMDMQECA
jgi:hypothetical protein